MTDCLHCGHEKADHRADDLRCPRIRPYIAGVVNVGDWESGTYYKEKDGMKSEDWFEAGRQWAYQNFAEDEEMGVEWGDLVDMSKHPTEADAVKAGMLAAWRAGYEAGEKEIAGKE